MRSGVAHATALEGGSTRRLIVRAGASVIGPRKCWDGWTGRLRDNGSLERQHLEALREERSLGLVVRERSTAKWQMANGKRSKPIPE